MDESTRKLIALCESDADNEYDVIFSTRVRANSEAMAELVARMKVQEFDAEVSVERVTPVYEKGSMVDAIVRAAPVCSCGARLWDVCFGNDLTCTGSENDVILVCSYCGRMLGPMRGVTAVETLRDLAPLDGRTGDSESQGRIPTTACRRRIP